MNNLNNNEMKLLDTITINNFNKYSELDELNNKAKQIIESLNKNKVFLVSKKIFNINNKHLELRWSDENENKYTIYLFDGYLIKYYHFLNAPCELRRLLPANCLELLLEEINKNILG